MLVHAFLNKSFHAKIIRKVNEKYNTSYMYVCIRRFVSENNVLDKNADLNNLFLKRGSRSSHEARKLVFCFIEALLQ